jgi:hypothetical protein
MIVSWFIEYIGFSFSARCLGHPTKRVGVAPKGGPVAFCPGEDENLRELVLRAKILSEPRQTHRAASLKQGWNDRRAQQMCPDAVPRHRWKRQNRHCTFELRHGSNARYAETLP